MKMQKWMCGKTRNNRIKMRTFEYGWNRCDQRQNKRQYDQKKEKYLFKEM